MFPGDILEDLRESESTGKIVLGPGLTRSSEEIIASQCGVLRHREPNIYWIDCHKKRVIILVDSDHICYNTHNANTMVTVDSDSVILLFVFATCNIMF